jgi:hypothetical protein
LHVGAFAGGLAAAEKRYENGQKKEEAVSHKISDLKTVGFGLQKVNPPESGKFTALFTEKRPQVCSFGCLAVASEHISE